MDKLHVVEGDAIKLNLGLSEYDRARLKSCSVIFHAAASVRFDDPLKDAILLNTRGTREVCELARTMLNLKALIHVSTAYIQPRNLYVKENVYPVDDDWKTCIKYAEQLDRDLLDTVTQKWVLKFERNFFDSKNHLRLTRFAPNTYTFSKHLAEQVCIDFRSQFDLPIVLYRPSIITGNNNNLSMISLVSISRFKATEVEPLPAWIDSLNGPQGLCITSALGINHVIDTKPTAELNTINVDICIKGMIVAAYKVSIEKHAIEDIPVYNAASIKCITLRSIHMDSGYISEYPSLKAVGVMNIFFVESAIFAWLLRIFLNIIPALIIDGVLFITRNKPRW